MKFLAPGRHSVKVLPPPSVHPSLIFLLPNTMRSTSHVTPSPGAKLQAAVIMYCQWFALDPGQIHIHVHNQLPVVDYEKKENFSKNKSKLLLLSLQPSNSCYVLISGLLQDSGTKGTIYKHYYETQRGSEQNRILLSQENWRELLPNIVTVWKMHFPLFHTSSPSLTPCFN